MDAGLMGLAQLPFADLVDELRSARRYPPITETLERLGWLRADITAIRVMSEYAPEKLPQWPLTLPFLLETDLTEPALEALSCLIPLNLDAIYNPGDFYDESEDGTQLRPLIIEPQGVNLDEDEFWEAVDHPDGYFSDTPGSTILPFALCLTNGIAYETWLRVAEHCDWPIDEPPLYHGHATNEFVALLFDTLQHAGLSAFQAVFKMTWFNTGFDFFDLSPLECYENAGPLTYENVCRLISEWQACQPLVQDYRAAEELVEHSPSILTEIIAIWDNCGEAVAPGTKACRTLAEAWGQEEPEDEVDDEGDE